MYDIEFINYWLALKVVGLEVLTAALFVLFFVRGIPSFQRSVVFVRQYGLWIGFLVALGASVTTLFYSEVLGIAPCVLCWWQRAFLYPQVMLLGIALWRSDSNIAVYSIVLSALGAFVALYHHALQMGWVTTQPCIADGGVDCAQRLLFEFGYITYPLMSLSVFVFLVVVMLHVRALHSRYEMSPAP